MVEETPGIMPANRRERSPHRLYQSLAGAGLGFSQDALDLGEGFPTFMCVVQVHTLDGACTDRGWLEKARLPMVLEELPLGPYGGSDR